MVTIRMPGFTADASVYKSQGYHRIERRSGGMTDNAVIPAVPMPYCKIVCKYRVCGSPLPGYPAPMCYSCEQECWIHDSGPYLMGFRA